MGEKLLCDAAFVTGGPCREPARFVLTPAGAGDQETFCACACAEHVGDLLLQHGHEVGVFRVEAVA